ncbi:hypothetical protein OIU76_012316 [Salix suchowensis]|nr:hypothetical protein OIU76_012316 [Salix suchowensis]
MLFPGSSIFHTSVCNCNANRLTVQRLTVHLHHHLLMKIRLLQNILPRYSLSFFSREMYRLRLQIGHSTAREQSRGRQAVTCALLGHGKCLSMDLSSPFATGDDYQRAYVAWPREFQQAMRPVDREEF